MATRSTRSVGTRSGLLAVRHLLQHLQRPPGTDPPQINRARQTRWAKVLSTAAPRGARLLALLGDYGIAVAPSRGASTCRAALAAAGSIGYPVVLKTDEPAVAHKSDVRGVVLGIRDAAELRAAYADLAARLGPRVVACETAAPGVELSVGIARDPDLGPLVVVGASGVLVEVLADRAVALPLVSPADALRLVGGLEPPRP